MLPSTRIACQGMCTLQVLGGDVSGIVEDSKAAEVTFSDIARALQRLQCARKCKMTQGSTDVPVKDTQVRLAMSHGNDAVREGRSGHCFDIRLPLGV